ncbi:ferrous iron transport protein A [Streptomyces sp. NPDC008222]|uniref:ferrous iron transport protein A n=1 Tax=Streptomyces sp. NPDC008222 TaxID=3364820 RepID=UPI0036EF6877
MSHDASSRSPRMKNDGGGTDVPWPEDAMAPGTRVTVVQDPAWPGPWLEVFQGTIDDFEPPAPVRDNTAHSGELAYWVVFDSPQYDSDGCGPYYKAQIWDRYLAPVLNR